MQKSRRVSPSKSRAGKKIAFGWYGGKFSHLDFLLPYLPNDARHFCDVFGGSAAVLINREPAPVETYNDLDSELVNFFATLRHSDLGKELMREIALTPFSREELTLACTPEGAWDQWSGRGGSTFGLGRHAPDWLRLRRQAAGPTAS